MNRNAFSTGLIEGFYGKPWSWSERTDILGFLKEHNYTYYIYAPKNDKKLRVEWQKPWTDLEISKIKEFRDSCRRNSISFGVGLSPYELYLNWTEKGRELLLNKLNEIKSLEADIIWILFDNMTGDRDSMAKTQIDIAHFIYLNSDIKKIAMCPTYYSFDPVLKALFGNIPKGYMEELGNNLNPDIDIIWTGPKVCSKEITAEHLQKVNSIFKRKVLLWDNYPVNDSARLTPFLFLGGFRNRTKYIKNLTSGHTVNPMVQPNLTRISMATLKDLYTEPDYNPELSWEKNAKKLLGEKFANTLKEDIYAFENRGVDIGVNLEILQEWTNMIEGSESFSSLDDAEKSQLVNERLNFEKRLKECFTRGERMNLIHKYGFFRNEYSQEIIRWLMGYYFFDPLLFS